MPKPFILFLNTHDFIDVYEKIKLQLSSMIHVAMCLNLYIKFFTIKKCKFTKKNRETVYLQKTNINIAYRGRNEYK